MKKFGLVLLIVALLFGVTSCTQYLSEDAIKTFNAAVNAALDIATQLADNPSSVPGAQVVKTTDPSTGSETAEYTYSGCSSTPYKITNMNGKSSIIVYPASEESANGVFNLSLEEFNFGGKKHTKLLLSATFIGARPESVDNIYYSYFYLDGVEYYPPKTN